MVTDLNSHMLACVSGGFISSHYISSCSVIVRVSVVLKRTVGDSD